jgi:hypothetical protein
MFNPNDAGIDQIEIRNPNLEIRNKFKKRMTKTTVSEKSSFAETITAKRLNTIAQARAAQPGLTLPPSPLRQRRYTTSGVTPSG